MALLVSSVALLVSGVALLVRAWPYLSERGPICQGALERGPLLSSIRQHRWITYQSTDYTKSKLDLDAHPTSHINSLYYMCPGQDTFVL